MKIILQALLVMICIAGQAQKTKVKLVGEFKGLKTNQVKIINVHRDDIASGVSENGKFEIEFEIDVNQDIRYYMYVPILCNNMPNPGSVYDFFADVEEVKLQGQIKGDKIINFKAISPMNAQYYKVKFESPSSKARIKSDKKARKADKALTKYLNSGDGSQEDMKQRSPENDPKTKELQDKAHSLMNKNGDINYQCSLEAADMLTKTQNKGLNAFLYATCRGLGQKWLKPIADKIRSVYSEAEIKSDYYLNSLIETYKAKAVCVKGEDIINYDFLDLEGNIVKFSDFKGKYLYVNLYDINFQPSMDHLTKMLELEEKYNDDIVFVHLNVNKEADMWRQFCKGNELSDGHIGINDKKEFFSAYNVDDLPRGILIDKESKMHTAYIGKQYGDRDDQGKSLDNGPTAEEVLKELFGK